MESAQIPKILIVGGGAGGLELATHLGKSLGKKGKAEITLIDKNKTHIWKPLLHEVATGSLDSDLDAVNYVAHAKNSHYHFVLGEFKSLNIERQHITLKPLYDNTLLEFIPTQYKEFSPQLILPERQLEYDYLVLCIGSVCNDFNVDGVKQHCIFLDSAHQAERFHHELLNAFVRSSQLIGPSQKLEVAIVGAGATGVELSAQLINSEGILKQYGFREMMDQNRIKITLIEASNRVLPGLPQRISKKAEIQLEDIGVKILTNHHVTKVDKEGIMTAEGDYVRASLKVWAAGVQAPAQIRLGEQIKQELIVNRLGQIEVYQSLRCKNTENIFAIGDCSSCFWKDFKGKQLMVPPRAQAAHQQASVAAHNIKQLIEHGKQAVLRPYQYRDYGSLVSMSETGALGSLMGNLGKNKKYFVEGRLARFMYISLYRNHQVAIHGWIKTALMLLIEKINRVIRPRLKLH